jgi:hypothetical protein
MNKILLMIGILGFLSSCDKLKELASANFGINGDAVTVKVPPSGGASTISFSSVSETIDFEAEIKKNNAELAAKYIKSVTINSMELEIISPAKALPNNFKNVKSYTFTAHSDVKADKISILSPDPFVPNETKINLPVNTALDIKDYVKEKAKFTYAFTGVLLNPTTDTLEIKIKANYQIKVGL